MEAWWWFLCRKEVPTPETGSEAAPGFQGPMLLSKRAKIYCKQSFGLLSVPLACLRATGPSTPGCRSCRPMREATGFDVHLLTEREHPDWRDQLSLCCRWTGCSSLAGCTCLLTTPTLGTPCDSSRYLESISWRGSQPRWSVCTATKGLTTATSR